MTPDQIADMLDLYLDDELPIALRTAFETYLAANRDANAEAQSIHGALTRLQETATERPDSWFVERTLDSVLRENAAQASPVRLLRQ